VPAEDTVALRVLSAVLSDRPINYDRLRGAVIGYVRSRRNEETPERVLIEVKAAFDELIRGEYAGAHFLRERAVSWAIDEYYRGAENNARG
jgi:hypothetical protein